MKDRLITPSEAVSQEIREREIERRAAWLGGIFEVGGSISITQHKQNHKNGQKVFIQTNIALNDNDHQRLESLRSVVGGSIYPVTEGLWVWKMQGKQAMSLVRTIKPYAPSRQDIVAGIELLEEATTQEKEEIAQELKGSDRYGSVTSEDYSDLCYNPEFLAGIIDCRGLISQRKRWRIWETQLALYSRNIALLEALMEFVGGSLDVLPAGTKHMVNGVERTMKQPAANWRIFHNNARRILESIEPFSVMRKEEISSALQNI